MMLIQSNYTTSSRSHASNQYIKTFPSSSCHSMIQYNWLPSNTVNETLYALLSVLTKLIHHVYDRKYAAARLISNYKLDFTSLVTKGYMPYADDGR